MRYAWLVMLAVGCYEAPDYGGTHFKCDDQHTCPDGQPCVNGFCNGSGSATDSGMGQPDTAGANGVVCGTTTCGSGMKCCADFVNPPACYPITTTCSGLAATCDGIEDCGGSPCCDISNTISCGTTTCSMQICRDNTDCKNPSAPMCCLAAVPNQPWGTCLNACP